jgi:hypothetical protein
MAYPSDEPHWRIRTHEVLETEVKGIEQTGALPDPPAHGLHAQFRAEAPEDLRLPVDR